VAQQVREYSYVYNVSVVDDFVRVALNRIDCYLLVVRLKDYVVSTIVAAYRVIETAVSARS